MEEQRKGVAGTWRIAAILALVGCLVLGVLYATKPGGGDAADEVEEPQAGATGGEGDGSNLALVDGDEALSLWAEGSAARQALVDYVEAVCDPDSPDFIPEEDRVATFDVDGTLINETDPNYLDYTLLVYRVLEDADYKDKASDFERSVAEKIVDQNENGTKYDELPVEHGQAVASAFKGMTVEEFYAYVRDFAESEMPSYEGMRRGEAFYAPMVQVVQYLQASGFDVYMVSGTDRLIMRGLFGSELCPLSVSLDHVLGSDESLVGSGQGDTDGLDYTFAQDDELVLGGDFLMKTLKENKCYIIQREIARQPVLSFGNSSGDFAMHNYALSNPAYRSMAFSLCCDDVERENGDVDKAAKMREDCEINGYVAISMADDWTTIYGDGVTYLGGQGELAEAA